MVTIWILFGTFLFVFGLIEVVSNALDYFLERACRVYPYGSDKNPQRVVVLSELRDGDMFMGNPKYPCQELPQYSASIGMDNPEYPGVYVVSLGGLVSMNSFWRHSTLASLTNHDCIVNFTRFVCQLNA